ncbi:MAG: AAA family ATPase [Wenzhouxiangellaceae bacterium]|nr:AAA family ATPase [Wenzhouxiangellaceae bacterium]
MHPALINALLNPAAYPHAVERVELIETHISWVLLAGAFVYKIKKPVDFGFLDFSTPDRRRHFCEEELRLNRRTAPELYLDVVEIRGTPEQPRWDGPGEVIETAVKMGRFDPDNSFDRLLADDRLPEVAIPGLARELADLHRVAAVAPADGRFGTFAEVAGPMRENFTDLDRLLAGTKLHGRLPALSEWTDRQLAELEPVIVQRLREGFVRECHGDAHLGNVAWIDGHATLFDCIEFSEALRWTDVMADLAFTVMDLRDRGAAALAWRLLDYYLTETGDYAGVRLLPLYVVYRAMVRAKVHALSLSPADASTRAGIFEEIDNYLTLAAEVAGEQRAAVLITMGVSGSGKSWLAERLVERCGLVRIRSDIERKRLFGLAPEQRAGAAPDQGLYTPEAGERTYDHLVELVRPMLDAGLPVLIDAACLKAAQRARFRALAAEAQVPFAILHTQADTATLRARIQARAATGNDPSDAGLDVLEHQLQSRPVPGKAEQAEIIAVDTSRSDALERAVAAVTARISAHPARD